MNNFDTEWLTLSGLKNVLKPLNRIKDFPYPEIDLTVAVGMWNRKMEFAERLIQ